MYRCYKRKVAIDRITCSTIGDVVSKPMSMAEENAKAPLLKRGRYYEDSEPGGVTASNEMAGGMNREVLRIRGKRREAAAILLALDIGGSLAKVAYTRPKTQSSGEQDIEIHLATFDTERLSECLQFIRTRVFGPNKHSSIVYATGVGCVKYESAIEEALQCSLRCNVNEMEVSAKGLDFLWRHLSAEQLVYDVTSMGDDVRYFTNMAASGLVPCLLVNIGSALTIVSIAEDGQTTELVGGSSQGGLTFLGLGALLTQAKDFHELLALAEQGDHTRVDLLVSDTAGKDYHLAPSDGMVSSFGKAAKARCRNNGDMRFKEEDLASSLLRAVTDELAQTTYLVAKCERLTRVCFSGSFISGNQTIINLIKSKLEKCCQYLKHTVKPIFLRHESYIGAIGAYVRHLEQQEVSDNE